MSHGLTGNGNKFLSGCALGVLPPFLLQKNTHTLISFSTFASPPTKQPTLPFISPFASVSCFAHRNLDTIVCPTQAPAPTHMRQPWSMSLFLTNHSSLIQVTSLLLPPSTSNENESWDIHLEKEEKRSKELINVNSARCIRIAPAKAFP